MFWLLFGVLLFLLIRNQFDMRRTAKDIRRIIRAVGRTVRDIIRTVQHAVKDAKKTTAVPGKTGSEAENAKTRMPAVSSEQAEVQERKEVTGIPQQDAQLVAMLASVPTLDFPENDPKYDSSRKYMYA